MAIINHSKREINAKIVLYGPPDSGKGSLLHFIHQRIKPTLCGSLKTMETGGDSLMFFDYVPFENSSLDGYRICFHMYTLTGKVENSGTWKMLLKGVDGLAVVAEKDYLQGDDLFPLISSLRSILGGYARDVATLPLVVLSVGDVSPVITAADLCSATLFSVKDLRDDGALSALAELSRQVMQSLRNQFEVREQVATAALSDDDDCDDDYTDYAKDRLTLPQIILAPSMPVSVSMPVCFTIDGRECRYTLSATLKLEPDD